MSPNELVAFGVGVSAIATSLLLGLRWVIKSYLSELKPNSGSLALQTNNGTTAVTITTGQNVAIGTTATTQKLWVNNGNVCVTNDYAFGFHRYKLPQ